MLVCAALTFSFAACAHDAPHVHAYTQWEHDEQQHWRVCPDDGAIDPAGKSSHDFTEGDCICGEAAPVDPRAEAYAFRPVIRKDMPAIYIETDDGSFDFATKPNLDMKHQDLVNYVGATVSVCGYGEESAYSLTAKAQVKARGNWTMNYEKEPIRIKFEKKQSVLGLNGGAKYKSWVLLADWKDLSMSNNTMAFYFGKTILGSDGYYSSDYRNVEVYINNQYWGMYLLVEQQEAKGGENGRSSVPEVEENYTGTDIGYFVEYDGYYTDERNMPNNAGDPTFELNYNNFAPLTRADGSTFNPWGGTSSIGYTVKSDIYPEAYSENHPQIAFIRSYLDNAYKIAYEAVYRGRMYKFNDDYSGIEPTSGSAEDVVSAVIDVRSLVDTYILNEIACDADIGWSSFYLSIDMTAGGSKKVIFEAPWDFDSAFGIKNGFVNNAQGLYAANSTNPWLVLLVREGWFRDMVTAKWAELVQYDVLRTALELVETQKVTFADQYRNNFTRWPGRLYGDGELLPEINTYRTQGEAADYLERWLHSRLNYLNAQWGDGSDVLTLPEGKAAAAASLCAA